MAISVVGAGVSGLTTAVVLAEEGFEVEVYSDLEPGHTTSAMAGASWGPFLADDPRILDWSQLSLRAFSHEASIGGSGVHMARGVEAYDESLRRIPRWAQQVPGFGVCGQADVPRGYVGAWRYTIPLIDMPQYLRHLVSRLLAAGGRLRIGDTLDSFDRLDGDVIVNCTGLRATEFLNDSLLKPIRGQLILVPNPGLSEFFQDDVEGSGLSCIFPHHDHVVLGGTSKPGEATLAWDRDEENEIRSRCEAIEPRLKGLEVLQRRIGLRPSRKRVRLEQDPDNPRLVHNYGHGGSGVTLSWGCAADVLTLAREIQSGSHEPGR